MLVLKMPRSNAGHGCKQQTRSSGAEHHLDMVGVVGSNPIASTTKQWYCRKFVKRLESRLVCRC